MTVVTMWILGVLFAVFYCFYILWRNNRVCTYLIFLIKTNWNLYAKAIEVLKTQASDPSCDLEQLKLDDEENDKKYHARVKAIEDLGYNKIMFNPFYLLRPSKLFTKRELLIAWDGKYKRGISTKGFRVTLGY